MMKRLLFGLLLVIGAWVLSPTPQADARGWNGARHAKKHRVRMRHHRAGFAAPELDPSAAGSALLLLVGGVAYIASRRREDELA